MPQDLSPLAIGIAISEVLALVLAWRILRSADPLPLRIANTLVAFIPFFGPLFAYWASSFPEPHHPAHRDNFHYSADVYERWADIIRTKSPRQRFARWKSVRKAEERRVE